MWYCAVFRHEDSIHVFGIGDLDTLDIVMGIKAFKLNDPRLLAFVPCRDGEQEANEIAALFSKKLNLPVK